MAQIVKLKRTAVSGKIPTTSNLELGELAMNTYDGRIFFEKDSGTAVVNEILTTNTENYITGSLKLNGAITASYFVGDGSKITNLPLDNVTVADVATVTSSFDTQSTITVSHNFNSKNVVVSVYDSNDSQIIPQSVTLTDNNTVQVVLSAAQSGFVVVGKGGHIVSGSAGDAANLNGQAGSYYLDFDNHTNNPFTQSVSAITASGHFVPSQHETYDLGSSTLRWKDLYLSGSTIDLGGTLITRDSSGDVNFKDSGTQALKRVVVDELQIGSGATARKIKVDSGKIKFVDTNDVDKVEESLSLPSGVVSGSSQVINLLPSGVISGSAFTTFSSSIDSRIHTEKDRIDAILTSATADADSFSEIVSLINSVDTTNDTAFANHYTSSRQRLTSLESFTSSIDTTIKTKLNTEDVLSGSIESLLPSGVVSGSTQVTGGSGIVSGSNQITALTTYQTSVSGNTVYTVTHNLSEEYPIVQAWNTQTKKQEIPQEIESLSTSQIKVTFATTFFGVIIVKQ